LRSTLGKVVDMQTTPNTEPVPSPIPGIIPEPVTVRRDDDARHRHRGTPSPRRQRAARPLLATVLDVIRRGKPAAAPPPDGR
jgi:hypothetical protein